MATAVAQPSTARYFSGRIEQQFKAPGWTETPLEDDLDHQEDTTSPKAHHCDFKSIQELPLLLDRDFQAQKHSRDGKFVVSPYITDSHLLDLDTVSEDCQLLTKALAVMRPVRPDYATAPYVESFNWLEIIQELRRLISEESSSSWKKEQSFFVVAFRSQIPPTTDRSHLGALDEVAHEEAMAGGGLLKYWFGMADSTGRNLATCVWRDIGDSKKGSTGRGHKQATRETRALYTEWKIDRLNLTIGPHAEQWSIVEWTD